MPFTKSGERYSSILSPVCWIKIRQIVCTCHHSSFGATTLYDPTRCHFRTTKVLESTNIYFQKQFSGSTRCEKFYLFYLVIYNPLSIKSSDGAPAPLCFKILIGLCVRVWASAWRSTGTIFFFNAVWWNQTSNFITKFRAYVLSSTRPKWFRSIERYLYIFFREWDTVS